MEQEMTPEIVKLRDEIKSLEEALQDKDCDIAELEEKLAEFYDIEARLFPVADLLAFQGALHDTPAAKHDWINSILRG